MTEQQTPTPIDPADIRPGDMVERRQRLTIEKRGGYDDEFYFESGASVIWPDMDEGWTWHLVHRPDPDAEVIEAIAKAVQDEFYSAKWESLHESTREMARQQARLALTIVRERDAKRAET